MPTTVFTIGHSTHPLAELVEMLAAHGVTTLADVRTIAKSRHNPQYMEDALAVSMPANGIRYVRLEELGGLRRTTKETVNGGWRNASFRGYADYMQTPEFVAGDRSPVGHRARAAHRHHVRRGGAVALPPIVDRRRTAGAGRAGARHHDRDLGQTAHDDQVRARRRHDRSPTRRSRKRHRCSPPSPAWRRDRRTPIVRLLRGHRRVDRGACWCQTREQWTLPSWSRLSSRWHSSSTSPTAFMTQPMRWPHPLRPVR